MKRLKELLTANRGAMSFQSLMILIPLLILCVIVVTTMTLNMSTAGARMKLEGEGYLIFSPSEYTIFLGILNNIHDDAETTVVAAVLAAEVSDNILDKLQAFNENEMYLFPDSTNKNVTLTAGAANTFSAWTEVADNTSTTLTSKFAATAGYIREVTMYAYSTPDKLCILELGYGQNIGAVTTIGRCLVRSDFTWVLEFFSEQVPVGEKVYYRFMSEQAAETFKVNFKYCYVV